MNSGARKYRNTDADVPASGDGVAAAAITATTPATATTFITLTQDRKMVVFTNATDKIVMVARRRVSGNGPLAGGAWATKFVVAIPAGAVGVALDLMSNDCGWDLGDVICVYAPVALSTGVFYGSAL